MLVGKLRVNREFSWFLSGRRRSDGELTSLSPEVKAWMTRHPVKTKQRRRAVTAHLSNSAQTLEEGADIIVSTAKCIVAFYSVYYIISSICFGAFELQTFDGKMPFDFKRWIDLRHCCVSYSKLEIANLVAMETTCFLSTWFFLGIVPRRFWDYVLTVTLIHIALSCLVMLSFPTNWSWWICLGLGVFIMISIGEFFGYFYRANRVEDKRDTDRFHPPGTGLTFYPKDSDHSECENVKT